MTENFPRQKALDLLYQYIQNENMRKHSLASEAVLKALAQHLKQDIEPWGLAGLLHDIDIELTDADLMIHGQRAIPILHEAGIAETIIDAIAMHNEQSTGGKKRSTLFHHALAAGETITGLITATALVYPDKKLACVKAKSIIKRMKEKAFAASVDREVIRECEKIGIPLPAFAEIALNAMQSIHADLGL